MRAVGEEVCSTLWTGRGMVLRSIAGCRTTSSWTLPWCRIFTAASPASLVDRLEALLEGGALSQSLSDMCWPVCVCLCEWACVLGGGLAPASSRHTCFQSPHHPHLPAISSSPGVYKCLDFPRRDARSLHKLMCVVTLLASLKFSI